MSRPDTASWLAGVGVALCLVLTWVSRAALNTDGVAYLDLARRVHAGDWNGFVQGYWSPLLPALVTILSAPTGRAPTTLVTLAHVVNGAGAIAGLALLWWWGRRSGRPLFTHALLAVFLLASSGLPRIEVVTPDVLLLALMAWVAYELLMHRGMRPVRSGLALGLAFLCKTSIWPWLLLSLPIRWWAADGPAGRRSVLLSTALTMMVAALWLIPLSLKTGRPTAGSAARLNYSWYIESSDARTPDTHTGRHTAYRTVAVDPIHQVTVVDYVGADRWTYAPWSDPTAWSDGIESSNAAPPQRDALLAYWGRQARLVFGKWILPVLLAVLLPCALAWRRPGLIALPDRDDRPAVAGLLLGLAGVMQFVVIHPEPRLIAPFVLLSGLAALDVVMKERTPVSTGRSLQQPLAVTIGWLCVLGLSVHDLRSAAAASTRTRGSSAAISPDPAYGPPGDRRIVVVGAAMPVVAAAFLADVHIVAQLPPRSLTVAQSLSAARQITLHRELFAGKARIAWITNASGGVRVVPVPPSSSSQE